MSIKFLEMVKSEKERMKVENQPFAQEVFELIEKNLFSDFERLEIKDALVYPVYKLLPRSIKLLVKIKQHLNTAYRNGINIFMCVSNDSIHVETSISMLDMYIKGYEIVMEFKRYKRNEKTKVIVGLSKETVNNVFNELVNEIIDFEKQSIPYKLIRMIVEASYKHKSIKIVDIRTL
jgi:hypothetical protein